MRKINTMISPDSLKKALSILSGEDVKNIHEDLGVDIDTGNLAESKVKRREQLYLFIEEFVPISYLSGTSVISVNTKNDILEGTYKTSVLPPKTKKLKELYNICVKVGPTDGKISYRSIDNLNGEILRILNKTKFAPLKTFFTVHGVTNYAVEFLNINGNTPNMFRNKLIMVYSALLNYDWTMLNTLMTEAGVTFKDILVRESLMTQTELTVENWTKLASLFGLFLDQLLTRTIHYDN